MFYLDSTSKESALKASCAMSASEAHACVASAAVTSLKDPSERRAAVAAERKQLPLRAEATPQLQ